MNSLPRCSASCLASSVLPTPVGPVNRKQPAGRSGWPRPGARALDRARDELRPLLPGRTPRGRAIPRASAGDRGPTTTPASPECAPCARRLLRSAARPTSSIAAGFAVRARRRRVSRVLRAGLVEHVDGAVGQPVVAQVPRRQLRRRLERIVGVAHAVVRLVARAQALQDAHGLLDRRLVDRDLLQPPRERAVLLDVLELLVRRRADHAQLAGREDRLDQRREVHRAAGRGAGADGRVDLVDEEDRHRALRERVDDRLEALLEVAAEARAGEQRRRVEREDLGALEQLRHVVLQQPRGEAFGERGLADAGVADEHRIVLAPAAEDLDRALQLVGAADQRIELAVACARSVRFIA